MNNLDIIATKQCLKKQISYITLIIFILLCMIGACKKNKSEILPNERLLKENTTQYSNTQTITLRMYVSDFPPLYYRNEKGLWSGLDVELVTAIVKQAGFEIAYEDIPWSRALHEMQRGNLDLMSTLSMTDERSEYMNWIGPVRESVMGLAVLKSDADLPITKLDDFIILAKARNSAFGIQNDVFYSPEFNERLKDSEFRSAFEYVNDASLNPKKTIAGRIIGYIEELYYLRYLLSHNPEYKNLVIHEFRLEPEKIYIGVSKQSVPDAIFQKLKQACDELKSNGTIDAILKKY